MSDYSTSRSVELRMKRKKKAKRVNRTIGLRSTKKGANPERSSVLVSALNSNTVYAEDRIMGLSV